MDQSTQTNLCQGIRACGLPKAVSHEILNTILLWERSNGEEWTVDRLKALKQWYETCLAGSPEPPPYFRKTAHGTPTGVWGALFKTKNPAKVLAVLSASSVFVEKRTISPKQRDKFVEALKGDPTQHRVDERDLKVLMDYSFRNQRSGGPRKIFIPDVKPVTPYDMTGSSIPISGGKILRLTESNRADLSGVALIESWRSIPEAVLHYLDRLDHLDWIPEELSDIPFTPRKRVTGNSVGRIGLIQEPGLKLRSVANPNRVAQSLTTPLATFWEKNMTRFRSDCIFDQMEGVDWVQGKLKTNQRLVSFDLSSATDRLDLGQCLKIAENWCLPTLTTRDPEQVLRYFEGVRYFTNLSRGWWDTPAQSELGRVRWEVGQPLGLYPSIRLLALTNNGIGCIAALNSGLDPEDSFRTQGDDIIMVEEMASEYLRLITSIGGVINHSKTITSDKVAEFAGRIILPNRWMLKTYKYKLPSDDNFMQIVSDLGPQAKGMLANRQRRMWEQFKYVPGYVYHGPWNPDSMGIPLEERVAWTESTPIVDEVPDPDPVTISLEQSLIKATRIVAGRENTSPEKVEAQLPWPVEDDIQSSRYPGQPKPSGDPRRKDGKSTLVRLENISRSRTFKTFPEFRKELPRKEEVKVAESQTSSPTVANTTKHLPETSVLGESQPDRDKPDRQSGQTDGSVTRELPKSPEKSTERSKPSVAAGYRRTVEDMPDIQDTGLDDRELEI